MLGLCVSSSWLVQRAQRAIGFWHQPPVAPVESLGQRSRTLDLTTTYMGTVTQPLTVFEPRVAYIPLATSTKLFPVNIFGDQYSTVVYLDNGQESIQRGHQFESCLLRHNLLRKVGLPLRRQR